MNADAVQNFKCAVPSQGLTGALQKVQSDNRFWIFLSTELKNHRKFKFRIWSASRASHGSRFTSTTLPDYAY
jgi:hypothetical protein